MAIKEENEITIKVICNEEKIMKCLKNKEFVQCKKFSLDDYYLVPRELDITKTKTRDILSKAVLIRYITENEEVRQTIAFKKKNINEKGEIESQKAFYCDVLDYKAALILFEQLGYYEIINIKEKDIVYSKDDIEFAVKFIENSDILIEFETNEKYDTIEKLKKVIDDIELPIEKDNYFVKKAENELNKKLNRI